MILNIFKDLVDIDGTISSGPKVATFKIKATNEILPILKREYPFCNWQACADGSDGMFESSNGQYGDCYVSSIDK